MSRIRRIARTSLPVLVQGESGSGKEGVSRALHRLGPRHAGPFVPINCTAVTESLLEAELFGAVRGAYTGLDRDRPGLFRQAHGGTLFLDEVGDMPGSMQAKLLRVLESGRVRPVGGASETLVDVRVVAATHRDLRQWVAEGRYRADLFYRLAVLRLDVPPLRDRLGELTSLVAELTPRLARETGYPILRLSQDAWRALRCHPWPGNIRELHATLARALLEADGEEIRASHLGLCSVATAPRATTNETLERGMIETALRETDGEIAGAATRIGWTRQKLYRRMQVLELRR
jgi:DNA-binding NtrC family response regulator